MSTYARYSLSTLLYELCLLALPFVSRGGQGVGTAVSPGPELLSNEVSLVTLRISVSSNIVEQGRELEVEVLLENNSSRQLSFKVAPELVECEVVVTTEAGQEALRTSFGKGGGPRFATSSGRFSQVGPNGQYRWRIPVTLLYDLTVPGRYWVKAKKRVYLSVEGQVRKVLDLESEPVEILVVRRADSRETRFRSSSASQ